MSALDKIKKAIAPSETSELAAATAQQETERGELNQLGELGDQLKRELAEAKRPLGRLSLDGSAEGRKAYDAAIAKVERLERELRRNDDAQVETRVKLQAINARIAELTHAERIRALNRLGSKREKKADEFQQCAVAFVHAYEAYFNATEEIVTVWPQVADSIGLDLRRLPDAVAIELYRLWPVGPISRNAASRVPGAHSGLGLEAPNDIPTLVETVRQENAAAVSNFKASVTPVVEAAPPLATISAHDITLKSVHLDLIDGRAK